MNKIFSSIGTVDISEKAVFDLLSSVDEKVLSESQMKSASKHELQKSLRYTKALANRLGRYGLAFYLAWSKNYAGTTDDIIRIAKASSRNYEPKFLHDKS